MIYKNFIYPAELPKAKVYWENKLNIDELDWMMICEVLNDTFIDRRIVEFQWKCLYGAINTEKRLQKWGKSNGYCKMCLTNHESLDHIMYQCSITKNLLKIIEAYLTRIIDKEVLLTPRHISFQRPWFLKRGPNY